MKGALAQLLIMNAILGGGTEMFEPRTFDGGRPPVIPAGCQEYNINGKLIIARTYENAIKKYKKRYA